MIAKMFKKSEVWHRHGRRYMLGLVCKLNRERALAARLRATRRSEGMYPTVREAMEAARKR